MVKKILVLALLVSLATISSAQINTHCDSQDDVTNCTTTTGPTYYERMGEENRRQSEEAGRALGNTFGILRQQHEQKKYCKQHQGENFLWTYPDGRKETGTCPGTAIKPPDPATALTATTSTSTSDMSPAERRAVIMFKLNHPDVALTNSNGRAVNSYFRANNLDWHDQKSWDRAYEDLKKDGVLDLSGHPL